MPFQAKTAHFPEKFCFNLNLLLTEKEFSYENGRATITIDINANLSHKSILAYTLSHELTHFIRDWSPAKYETFTNFLLENYQEIGDGETAAALIDEKMAKGMSYDLALEEVTAESCQKFLMDSNAMGMIRKLARQDQSLVKKLASGIKSLADRLRESFKGHNPQKLEYVLTQKMVKSLDQMHQMWMDALEDAALNYRAASQGTIDKAIKGKTRNQDSSEEDSRYSDYDKPITMQDVKVVQSIAEKYPKGTSIKEIAAGDVPTLQKWAYKFYKELGVKSPFFTAWFGDWRAHDTTKTKVASVPTIDLENIVYSRGNYQNGDTGWMVQAGGILLRETRHYSGREKISVKALAAIRDILQNGVLLDTEVSAISSNEKATGTAFMHKLYTPIRYDGRLYIAKTSIEEYLSKSSGRVERRGYHLRGIQVESIQENDIKREPAGETATEKSASGLVPDTGSEISISNLYDLVKQFDKDFTPAKSVNPALLNEDGTPKVFYHGTDAEFTAFDPGETAAREGSFFFTENREDAQSYGKNVLPVYLTGEKLADYDNQPAEFYRLENKRAQVDYLKNKGYDGWYSDMDSGGWGEVSVFSPTQIKSATDNIGTFDRETSDIRYQEAFEEDKYFSRKMDHWEDLDPTSYTTVGKFKKSSPLVLIGMPEGKLYYDNSAIASDMTKHSDHLTPELMKMVPRMLANPIAITEYKPGEGKNTVSVFGDLDLNGVPVTVGIVAKFGRGGTVITKVTTTHARRDIDTQITDESILYLNENKKETNAWFQAKGHRVPVGGTKYGLIRSISLSEDLVNTRDQEASEDDYSPRQLLAGALRLPS